MDLSIRFSESGLASIRSQLASIRHSVRFIGGIGSGSLSSLSRSVSFLNGAFQIAAGTVASGVAIKFAEDFFRAFFTKNPLRKALIKSVERLSFSVFGSRDRLNYLTKPIISSMMNSFVILSTRIRHMFSSLLNDLRFRFPSFSFFGRSLNRIMEWAPIAISSLARGIMFSAATGLAKLAKNFNDFFFVFFNSIRKIGWPARLGQLVATEVALAMVKLASGIARSAMVISPAAVSGTSYVLLRAFSGLSAISSLLAYAVVGISSTIILMHRGVQESLGRALVFTTNFVSSSFKNITSGVSSFFDAFRMGLAKITSIWQFASESSLVRLGELDRRFSPTQIEEFKLIETIDERMNQNWEKFVEKMDIINRRVQMMFERQNIQMRSVIAAQQRREQVILYGR